ncbi:hypothetical protein IV203_001407 [Nitzschia inconspicua]|uniref:Uncharacterized protein n=1 Tax=Nitzschia inconspicua TaxID=303405 RepID=A0A9K3L8I7_9STRA|nr:hypothetical protein IV203_001407 [Nitzschia inconspicua]
MSPKDSSFFESPNDASRNVTTSPVPNDSPIPARAIGKKIHFDDEPQVLYMSTEETELRTQYKSDIWYLRSELVTMRKSDRESLLLSLRNVASRAQERANAILQSASSSSENSVPPPPKVDSPSEFCFRGMEIILYKKEREECRRRAMQAVLSEQNRQRVQQKQQEGQERLVAQPKKVCPQQQISDVYKLMTRKAFDDAYLRGLGDAQEARTIFQQSLHFPSASTQRQANKQPEESKNPESPSGTCRRETIGDDQREALGDILGPAALNDILSQKIILQRNSLLKSISPNNPVALRLAAKYQSDPFSVDPTWNYCAYATN